MAVSTSWRGASLLEPRPGGLGIFRPGGVEDAARGQGGSARPMAEINFLALGVERLAVAERHARRLVEAFVRSARHDFRQQRDFHAPPMRDEIDERLREELAALANVVKDLRIRLHRLDEVREL